MGKGDGSKEVIGNENWLWASNNWLLEIILMALSWLLPQVLIYNCHTKEMLSNNTRASEYNHQEKNHNINLTLVISNSGRKTPITAAGLLCQSFPAVIASAEIINKWLIFKYCANVF